MKGVDGFDQYSGNSRRAEAQIQGVHVLLTVEDGATMLTPNQVLAFTTLLNDLAGEVNAVEELTEGLA
jgi:hypothetical protein